MIAFELWHNGKKMAVAGGDDLDTLIGILRWTDEAKDIEVSGLDGHEERLFAAVPIKAGDELLIQVKDVSESDLTDPIWRKPIADYPMGDSIPSTE